MNSSDDDDSLLIERVRRGDQQAFLALYDRHAARVQALTLHILGDSMLAEEATQDTFMKLWSRARLYLSERGSFTVWLLTIARRTALDRLRLEGRRPLLSDSRDPDDVWPYIPDTTQDPDEARWKSLYFAVRSLPHEQQIVIELAYYQGLSQSEIAAELGWPLGTVKTRIRAAMQALRREWSRGDLP
ncbi:MAG TPA: sigma-70 family RNA polymerase sigma factor [Anaerolineales bacterium]